jgi:hypothetical protein
MLHIRIKRKGDMMNNTKSLNDMIGYVSNIEDVLSRFDCAPLQYSDIINILESKSCSQTLLDICKEGSLEYTCENIKHNSQENTSN